MKRADLEAFLEVVDAGSVQNAAARAGRGRATYQRALARLESSLGGAPLVRTGPGQRRIELTRAGARFETRARAMLAAWHRWQTETSRAVGQAEQEIRVGALGGAFDLLADLVRSANIEGGRFVLVESPADRLPDAVAAGDVDVAVGAKTGAPIAPTLTFDRIGPLPWAVILPAARADDFPEALRLADLGGVPMVVHRSGPARTALDRCFFTHPEGPLDFTIAVEVESTPRMVDMVAAGFGPAIVTRFRTRYLPKKGVVARALLDGPAPMVAGLYSRRASALPEAAKALLQRVRAELGAVVRGA